MGSFFRAGGDARRRLISLPHAGGADVEARAWRPPAGLELLPVLLPGRGARAHEPPYRAMAPLVDDLLAALPTDRPYTLYGHSFGARVALALGLALRDAGAPLPERLIVGAAAAPHLADPAPPLAGLPQAALIDEVQRRWGALEPALLASEHLALFLKPLRADLRVLEGWTPPEVAPLPVPILALHGDRDPSVTVPAVEAWARWTTSDFERRVVAGDHFFHRQLDPCRLD